MFERWRTLGPSSKLPTAHQDMVVASRREQFSLQCNACSPMGHFACATLHTARAECGRAAWWKQTPCSSMSLALAPESLSNDTLDGGPHPRSSQSSMAADLACLSCPSSFRRRRCKAPHLHPPVASLLLLLLRDACSSCRLQISSPTPHVAPLSCPP